MSLKSVLVVKNLLKFSDISEHIMKRPKILEGFRNYRNFVRKGRSAAEADSSEFTCRSTFHRTRAKFTAAILRVFHPVSNLQ